MDFNTTTTAPELASMNTLIFGFPGHALQTAVIAALIFAVCSYLPKLNNRLRLAKLPAFNGATASKTHRQGYLTSAKAWYSEGYQKV
jgi:hypothetical protein